MTLALAVWRGTGRKEVSGRPGDGGPRPRRAPRSRREVLA